MSRSSVPFSMPSCHIQLKSTERRSLAPAAGVYGAPAFGSLLRPRPCAPAPAGACCAPSAEAMAIARKRANANFIVVLRPGLVPELRADFFVLAFRAAAALADNR